MHSLAYLHKIILITSQKPLSFQLAKNVFKLRISEDSILISLDVVSLFTNVPIDLIIRDVEVRWHLIQQKMPKNEFIHVLNLVFNPTFFTFNDRFYRQSFDVPMGSPLSPVVSDIVLQDLESVSLMKLSFTPDFYFRHVDDIAMATHKTYVNMFLDTFNNYHARLKFTLEVEGETLNFLDVTTIKEKNFLIHWYHKPTFSGRYLNYFSYHTLCQKTEMSRNNNRFDRSCFHFISSYVPSKEF